MTQFDLYAAYYNLLYKDKDYATEVGYLDLLIKEHNGKDKSSILELGCGTGGHAFHFAKRHWQVQGIDLSEKMIFSANERKNKMSKDISSRLAFEPGDARTYRFNASFDVVLSLFHVMSYQVTNEDLVSVFSTVRSNLKKGGLFIFDFWYGPGVLTDRPKNVEKIVENEVIKVHRKTEPTMMINNNCVDIKFKINIHALNSNEKKTIVEHHMMRYWFLPELQNHLLDASIDLLGAYRWMTLDAMSDNTWYGCIVGRAV